MSSRSRPATNAVGDPSPRPLKVSEFLTPHLRGLEAELRAVVPRLGEREDVEAVHDFRVVLRRLRSLLRPARRVYGKFHTDGVRAALKGVADASGGLRDEEVLEETLAKVAISPAGRLVADDWLSRRKRRLLLLRAALLRLVDAGAVTRALTMLDGLLSLPVSPKHDKRVDAFARKVVLAAQQEVEDARDTALEDTTGLHELRILYKRLRYAVDGFAGVLLPELAAMAPVAAKFQKRLGDIHDIDVAVMTLKRARGMSAEARGELFAALVVERERVITKYVADKTAPPKEPPKEPPPVLAVASPRRERTRPAKLSPSRPMRRRPMR